MDPTSYVESGRYLPVLVLLLTWSIFDLYSFLGCQVTNHWLTIYSRVLTSYSRDPILTVNHSRDPIFLVDHETRILSNIPRME